MKRLTPTASTILAAGLLCSQQVQAALVQGDIDFAGEAVFDTAALSTATRVVTFMDAAGTSGRANVVGTSGDFMVIPFGTSAIFAQPYVFNPSTPVPGMWSVGGFTFNLATSTIVSQTASFLNISGTGTLVAAGFDPTPGLWTFTSNSAGGATSPSFSFAANARGVPEGGAAVALLGGALVGIEVLRRKLAVR